MNIGNTSLFPLQSADNKISQCLHRFRQEVVTLEASKWRLMGKYFDSSVAVLSFKISLMAISSPLALVVWYFKPARLATQSFHGIQWLPEEPHVVKSNPSSASSSSFPKFRHLKSSLSATKLTKNRGVAMADTADTGNPWCHRPQQVAFLLLFEATLLQQLRDFGLPVLAPTDFLCLGMDRDGSSSELPVTKSQLLSYFLCYKCVLNPGYMNKI